MTAGDLRELPPAPRTIAGLRARSWRGIAPVVVALGVVSFFTDVATEMIGAALPGWLLQEHGFEALALGTIEGAWRGGAAVVGLVAALAADRWRRRKLAAFVGYGISAGSKPLLLLAGSWPAIAVLLAVDRAGKGVRTAPRDALISLASAPEVRARAFAVHRSLDTLGMLLGPFAAFAILALAPGRFDAVVVASTCAALIGLAALWAFVDEPAKDEVPARGEAPRSRLGSLLARAGLRRILMLAAVLGVASVGEMQIAVLFERGGALASTSLPLFFAGIACSQLVLTAPAGRIADRFGRARTFVLAHVLLLATLACALARPDASACAIAAVVLLGGYLAATDGVLAAAASLASPARSRTTAIALAGGTSGAARLVASIAFGSVWAAFGSTAALVVFASALFLALAASAMLWRDVDATEPP